MTNNMNLNPKNLMMLAILGIGGYILLTKRANAAPAKKVASRPPTTYPSSPAPYLVNSNTGLAAAGINLLGSLFKGSGVNYSAAPNQTNEETARLARYESAANYSSGPDQSTAETDRLARYQSAAGETANNPTYLVTSDPQLYASTGGFLDSQ